MHNWVMPLLAAQIKHILNLQNRIDTWKNLKNISIILLAW